MNETYLQDFDEGLNGFKEKQTRRFRNAIEELEAVWYQGLVNLSGYEQSPDGARFHHFRYDKGDVVGPDGSAEICEIPFERYTLESLRDIAAELDHAFSKLQRQLQQSA